MRLRILAAGGVLSAWCSITALAAAPTDPTARPSRPGTPAAAQPAEKPVPPEQAEFFEKEVRPVLAKQCFACHGPNAKQSGLRVDSLEALLKGGSRGAALVPGDPGRSLLVQSVRHQNKLEMPPGETLPARQVDALEKWVKMGAPWPGSGKPAPAKSAAQTWDAIFKERSDWWSLKPVRKPAVPAVKNVKWSADPIDRFLLSALEKRGLNPAPRADRRTLARRVYLTLTGLPPTPEEVEAFVNDPAPNAYTKLADRVLASPHYGECWARHWMDVVRYGETHGYEWNYEIRDAWRYRDYLIRAFNSDLPYDQFVREHLAGDLLPKPRMNPTEGFIESVTGTAFYRFVENGHDVFKEIGLDVLDNQIDTLSKAFQATTVACARCHDHKLDAVSQKDYYGLLGILVSSRQVVNPIDTDAVNAPREAKLKALKEGIRSELAAEWRRELADTDRYLRAAQAFREKRVDAGSLAAGLDPQRIQAWATALEKHKAALEDPLNAWAASAEAAAGGKDVATAWKGLAARYAGEQASRADFNQKNYTSLGDFTHGKPRDWRVAGLGLRDGAAHSGEFTVATEGDRAVSAILPAGCFTHLLSERLGGAMESPWLPANKRFISLQVTGGKNGVVRMIPDHRQLTDTGRELPADGPRWITVGRSQTDEWLYLELITKMHNARYMGDGDTDPRSYFGITRVVLHDNAEPPKDELSRFQRLFGGDDPTSLEGVAAHYKTVLESAVDAWAAGRATDDDALWLEWLQKSGLVANSVKTIPTVAELVGQYRAVEKELVPSRLVAGVADQDDGFDVPVYLRGDYKNHGDIAPRHFLQVLDAPGERVRHGSGRWDLAEHVASPKNPLTARVMVNRIWHHLFGTGIVRTTDDFGHMGEAPSHPELLDYLATRFMEDGWSVKRLIRSVVLTQAFQQSGQAGVRAKEEDPENLLLHHFPARRLEAEAIRDSILTVSGRLDGKLYGPSIQPYRVHPTPERRLFQGPLDGEGRRSIYTKITLMEGPQFLTVFNLPDPKASQGRRDVTNVPAQALTLLNDPFVIGQAEFWANRLVAEPDATIGARVDRMFRTALGRPPQKVEAERFEKAIRDLAAIQNVAESDILKSQPVWKDAAHAVFNLKEFIYVR